LRRLMLDLLVREFRVVLWKELLDLSRDYRTIIAVVVLPLISLPSLALLAGFLAASQSVSVAVIIEDEKAFDIAERLSKMVEERAGRLGVHVNVTVTKGSEVTQADVRITIPRGFHGNLTRLDGQAVVVISKLVGSPASDIVYRAVLEALYDISVDVVNERIGRLASIANLTVNPNSLRNPILVSTGYHLAGGAPAEEVQAEVAATAKILQFSLFFVAYPAIVFMSDAIVGERERRTIEKLLVAPISRGGILAGKMVAATILGLLAALADSIALLAFFYLALGALKISLTVALAWTLSSLMTITVTVAIATIIASRSETVRSAQVMSSIVVMIAMAIYFSALIVDLTKLPSWISLALQLIPFTHSALVVQWASLGDLNGILRHLAILAFYQLALSYISIRTFNSERLILIR
jgi:ABC-2 type transport system permease protein